ncbi:fizzy-related protein homolog isoform X2 [Daktulosphaira vitifoliae]|uniref:fizzy-related protein homolog isoform X2 n=1 Tax=Daktulosphaira vitifoliae TaxID=58002 RepID=UPI0021AA150C|nr:fizzy-related protein homolog isoform X2 [Daktulosphaira vitifoliae]
MDEGMDPTFAMRLRVQLSRSPDYVVLKNRQMQQAAVDVKPQTVEKENTLMGFKRLEEMEVDNDPGESKSYKKFKTGQANISMRHEQMAFNNFRADRFIPYREANNLTARFNIISDFRNGLEYGKKDFQSESANKDGAYKAILHNELLGSSVGEIGLLDKNRDRLAIKRNLFQFYSSSPEQVDNIQSCAPYSLSPLGAKSQEILRSPRKIPRKISRVPYKVLDAPELQDDFYLNLVDWSSSNLLAVGLGSCVYLWSATTSKVTRISDLSSDGNVVTSVAWNDKGNYLAFGTQEGSVEVWDIAAEKQVNSLTGHAGRVGAIAWNGDVVSSGSRDRNIFLRDMRGPSLSTCRRYAGHRQEVCGLKWSPDNRYLASGGNDNRLYVWNTHAYTPQLTYNQHTAAVKAIAWSPHQRGLLTSGGGTADKCIRFWNTLTGQPMQCIDTGSQVCNLAWSRNTQELVSTHGYSQNQIVVWKYPSMSQIAKLTGHTFRVLYLSMSPDGESIVTGAGDETLRFWNIFSKARSQKEPKSKLNLFTNIR